MAFSDISLLAIDQDFINRCVACATVEFGQDGYQWAFANAWVLAATPGFGDKYASALAANSPRPGWDQAVISDGDILSAVQAIGVP